MSHSAPSEFSPIVLIDDNADDLGLFHRMLRKETGRPIHTFEEPAQGLAFLRGLATDPAVLATVCVFCDLRMPVMDGFAVLHAVRSEPALRAARFVMISGCALEEDVERARAGGSDGYLEKMPSEAILRETLRTPGFPAVGSRPDRFRAWSASQP